MESTKQSKELVKSGRSREVIAKFLSCPSRSRCDNVGNLPLPVPPIPAKVVLGHSQHHCCKSNQEN
jgi:hypothetical protein